MIYCLTGKIIKKTMNAVVVSCGGVGYYAQCPASVAGGAARRGKRNDPVHRDERDGERCQPLRLCHRGAAGLL